MADNYDYLEGLVEDLQNELERLRSRVSNLEEQELPDFKKDFKKINFRFDDLESRVDDLENS